MDQISDKKKANRLARAIASDISIYNQDKIKQGIINDNLFQMIEKDFVEGQQLFKSRVIPAIADKTNLFEKAIIDIVIFPKADVKSKIW